jgi:hypothetical protein
MRNRVDQNIVSASDAAAKMLETLPEQPQPRNLHADGAYVGKDLKEAAGEKNIVIRSTDPAGKRVVSINELSRSTITAISMNFEWQSIPTPKSLIGENDLNA